MMMDYDVHPMYFGQNIIRFENFLSDLNTLMTDKVLNFDVDDAIAYLLKKYELKNACYFNRDSFCLMQDVVRRYLDEFLRRTNAKKSVTGTAGDDLAMLREKKG